jgi:hypothetical protein
MAYLKTNDYLKAEDDATSALKLEPTHSKSFQRRATARNALGKHKAALRDFECAFRLTPTNKQLSGDIHKTRELVSASIRRTPRTVMTVLETNTESLGPMKSATHDTRLGEPAAPRKETKENFVGSANMKELAMQKAKKAVAHLQQQSNSQIPDVPKTSFEFARVLVGLKDSTRRGAFLRKVDPSKLHGIFKSSFDSSVNS